MTILQKFVSFTEGLPAERREALEATLAALMASYSVGHDFTDSEMAEIDRRLADPAPLFADPDQITELFGKRFSA